MKKRLVLICALMILVTAAPVVVSCDSDQSPPMPGRAHTTMPDGSPLPDGQIVVPFPYIEKTSEGDERWVLYRGNSNQLFLMVSWRTETVALFPLEGPGLNEPEGHITLDGKNYEVLSVTVHSDDLPYGSGWIILEETSTEE